MRLVLVAPFGEFLGRAERTPLLDRLDELREHLAQVADQREVELTVDPDRGGVAFDRDPALSVFGCELRGASEMQGLAHRRAHREHAVRGLAGRFSRPEEWKHLRMSLRQRATAARARHYRALQE